MLPRRRIVETTLPPNALLRRYARGGGYTDCFTISIPGAVSLADYIEAFYTTLLFKLERLVLALFVARPSTDLQARALAAGEADRFAAWTVEGREARQILMRDFMGSTRSWLMAASDLAEGATTLHFGTAVVPHRGASGVGFRAMIPFHRIYARALLRAAARRLGAA